MWCLLTLEQALSYWKVMIKKIPYYSKAIISWSVCAITGEYGIDFLINYAITYIFALG